MSKLNEIFKDYSISEKKQIMDTHKIEKQWESHQQNQNDDKKAEILDLNILPEDYFDKLDNQYQEMVEDFGKHLPFITPELSSLVPFHAQQLILVGAKTGEGKTTASANIMYGLYKENKKVLILSNEELTIDIYTRVACLELGLNINNRKQFTATQHQQVRYLIRKIGVYIRVIDSNFNNNTELTSSIEGMKTLFKKVKENPIWDAIIVDYYQKVSKSKYRNDQTHSILQEFTTLLDLTRKECKCPIVVMCQLHPTKKEDVGFEGRIKLGKSIVVSSTFILEMESNKETNQTIWVCQKGRWGGVGQRISTKWVNGKYISIDKPIIKEELKTEIKERKSERDAEFDEICAEMEIYNLEGGK